MAAQATCKATVIQAIATHTHMQTGGGGGGGGKSTTYLCLNHPHHHLHHSQKKGTPHYHQKGPLLASTEKGTLHYQNSTKNKNVKR